MADGQVRMWLNLGKADAVAEDSLGALLESLGAPAGKLLRLEVRGNYSYLDVGDADATAFEQLGGKQHAGKALKIERARK